MTVSLAAMRADLQRTPAWSLAPPPTDDFLLMFLRTELFSPSAAADRYRKFWKVFSLVVVFARKQGTNKGCSCDSFARRALWLK